MTKKYFQSVALSIVILTSFYAHAFNPYTSFTSLFHGIMNTRTNSDNNANKAAAYDAQQSSQPSKEINIRNLVNDAFGASMSQADKQLCVEIIEESLMTQLGTFKQSVDNAYEMSQIIDSKLALCVVNYHNRYISKTLDNDAQAIKEVKQSIAAAIRKERVTRTDISKWLYPSTINPFIEQKQWELVDKNQKIVNQQAPSAAAGKAMFKENNPRQ